MVGVEGVLILPMYLPKSSGGARGWGRPNCGDIINQNRQIHKYVSHEHVMFTACLHPRLSSSSSVAAWTGSRMSSPQTCGGRGVCRHITEPTARLSEDQTWRTAAEVNTDELQLFRMFIRQQHCGTTPVCTPATGNATNTQHHA